MLLLPLNMKWRRALQSRMFSTRPSRRPPRRPLSRRCFWVPLTEQPSPDLEHLVDSILLALFNCDLFYTSPGRPAHLQNPTPISPLANMDVRTVTPIAQ